MASKGFWGLKVVCMGETGDALGGVGEAAAAAEVAVVVAAARTGAVAVVVVVPVGSDGVVAGTVAVAGPLEDEAAGSFASADDGPSTLLCRFVFVSCWGVLEEAAAAEGVVAACVCCRSCCVTGLGLTSAGSGVCVGLKLMIGVVSVTVAMLSEVGLVASPAAPEALS
eukprot:CAMPEP_0206574578 /NCGR_PEP_ID=MMETSP0325_2-20121206/29540_1 /ASSEMBLY_ACC=CAM_ASM_000347 /TAXON_ID=2866 /ORGANISM="Crypthecodinium cohnii, Strain Seligo" /LENGTH=167 /DNA_ID=CAMNT_0054079231 /DNA_START=515 /DNA_END=1018 /DNA_ORIENTATION=-